MNFVVIVNLVLLCYFVPTPLSMILNLEVKKSIKNVTSEIHYEHNDTCRHLTTSLIGLQSRVKGQYIMGEHQLGEPVPTIRYNLVQFIPVYPKVKYMLPAQVRPRFNNYRRRSAQYPFCIKDSLGHCRDRCRLYDVPYKNFPESGYFPKPPGPAIPQFRYTHPTRPLLIKSFEVRPHYTRVPFGIDNCLLSTHRPTRLSSCFSSTTCSIHTPPCFSTSTCMVGSTTPECDSTSTRQTSTSCATSTVTCPTTIECEHSPSESLHTTTCTLPIPVVTYTVDCATTPTTSECTTTTCYATTSYCPISPTGTTTTNTECSTTTTPCPTTTTPCCWRVSTGCQRCRKENDGCKTTRCHHSTKDGHWMTYLMWMNKMVEGQETTTMTSETTCIPSSTITKFRPLLTGIKMGFVLILITIVYMDRFKIDRLA